MSLYRVLNGALHAFDCTGHVYKLESIDSETGSCNLKPVDFKGDATSAKAIGVDAETLHSQFANKNIKVAEVVDEADSRSQKEIEDELASREKQIDSAAYTIALTSFLETYSDPDVLKTKGPTACFANQEFQKSTLVIAPSNIKVATKCETLPEKFDKSIYAKVDNRYYKVVPGPDDQSKAFHYVGRSTDLKKVNMIMKHHDIDVVAGGLKRKVSIPTFVNSKKVAKKSELIAHIVEEARNHDIKRKSTLGLI